MTIAGWPPSVVRRKLHLALPLAALLAIPAVSNAAVTIAQPASTPVEEPRRQPAVTAIVPLSAAALPGADAPAVSRMASDFETPAPAMAPFHKISSTPILGGFSLVEIAGIGIVLIGLTAFARRRHRQLVGWGFIPDRSLRRTPPTS